MGAWIWGLETPILDTCVFSLTAEQVLFFLVLVNMRSRDSDTASDGSRSFETSYSGDHYMQNNDFLDSSILGLETPIPDTCVLSLTAEQVFFFLVLVNMRSRDSDTRYFKMRNIKVSLTGLVIMRSRDSDSNIQCAEQLSFCTQYEIGTPNPTSAVRQHMFSILGS